MRASVAAEEPGHEPVDDGVGGGLERLMLRKGQQAVQRLR